MKALSVRQPWASLIASGRKTIETRTWPTSYRGPLLIVASKTFGAEERRLAAEFAATYSFPAPEDLPLGKALAVANLADCQRMTAVDEWDALCKKYPGAWSWFFSEVGALPEPFPVSGRLALFEVEAPMGVNLITKRSYPVPHDDRP